MHGLNRCTLVGCLGADPELTHTRSGTALLKLRLAVNEKVRRDRDWHDHTEWFAVAVWGKRAEALHALLVKGSAVMVEGPLRTSSWEGRDGSKRTTCTVNAATVLLLGRPRSSEPEQPTQAAQPINDSNGDMPF